MLWLFGALAASYLIGGFPTGIIAGKILRGIDIREHGSGNAGATNAWRVLGPGPGVGVLLVDALKGVIPVLLVARLATEGMAIDLASASVACGLMAVVGHVWTPFSGFRGGKGVGTAAGVFAALAPVSVLIAIAVFIIVVAITRYISAGSIAAATALPVAMFAQRAVAPESMPPVVVALGCIIATLVVLRHRSNIRRLLNGTENRFSFSRKVAAVKTSTAEGTKT